MSNITEVSTENYQIVNKKTRGRRGKEVEALETQRMRNGVKTYVREQLAAGRQVCPILTKYVSELEMGHVAQ